MAFRAETMSPDISKEQHDDTKYSPPALHHGGSTEEIISCHPRDETRNVTSEYETCPLSVEERTSLQNNPGKECDVMLETLDTCVALAGGVYEQQTYEEGVAMDKALVIHGLSDSGLSEKEVALIKLQIWEKKDGEIREKDMIMGNFNLCGLEDSIVKDWEGYDSRRNANDCDLHCRSCSPVPSMDVEVEPETPPESCTQCAICFGEQQEDENQVMKMKSSFVHLPCCGDSDKKICTSCIVLHCSPTTDGEARIGRCPLCRAWLSIQTNGEVSPEDSNSTSEGVSISILKINNPGQCEICNQQKEYLVDNYGSVCDACYLGRRSPLRYECDQCHNMQTIPHPMYRYQTSQLFFGTTSWKCHSECKKFTKWRLVSGDHRQIPAGDAPLEWNVDYMEVARRRVMKTKKDIFAASLNRPKTGQDAACVIC